MTSGRLGSRSLRPAPIDWVNRSCRSTVQKIAGICDTTMWSASSFSWMASLASSRSTEIRRRSSSSDTTRRDNARSAAACASVSMPGLRSITHSVPRAKPSSVMSGAPA